MFARLIAITLAIAVLAVGVNGEEGSEAVSGRRQPKLFYISSSTTTSTFTTNTVCFKAAATLATCARKKRKRDIMSELQDAPESIKPSRNSRMDEEELEDVLEAVEKETENQRDPKFLLYWATLTSTSTSTTYTATQTFYSLECTPTAFGTSAC
jgi:hypothetical protein